MSYAIKPLPFKPPRLHDLPAAALSAHYQDIYGADARKLYQLTSKPVAGDAVQKVITLYSRLALQEAFYDSLGGEDGVGSVAVDPVGKIAELLKAAFTSVSNWQQQFESLLRQIFDAHAMIQEAANHETPHRWAILGYSTVSGQLAIITADADAKIGASFHPLIVIDTALAHLPVVDDLTSDKLAAIVIKNIHWGRANNKLQELLDLNVTPPPVTEAAAAPLPQITSEELALLLNEENTTEVIDVCLPEDITDRYDQVPGASCIVPDELANRYPKVEAQIKAKTDSQKLFVIYCMFGFQVSQQATTLLRQHGYNARLLSGGIAAWRAAGNRVAAYNHDR